MGDDRTQVPAKSKQARLRPESRLPGLILGFNRAATIGYAPTRQMAAKSRGLNQSMQHHLMGRWYL